MSLSWKIKNLSIEEREVFNNMLNKCLKIRTMWVKCLADKSKTDQQCEFAWNKLIAAIKGFKERFEYLNMDNFTLEDIKIVTSQN